MLSFFSQATLSHFLIWKAVKFSQFSETLIWNWSHSPQLAWISVRLLFSHFFPLFHLFRQPLWTLYHTASNQEPIFILRLQPPSYLLITQFLFLPYIPDPKTNHFDPLISQDRTLALLFRALDILTFRITQKSVALYKQHRREYFASRAGIIKKPRFNRHLHYKLKPEFSSWEIIYWDGTRQEYIIKNNSLPSQRIVVPLRTITAHLPR